MANFVLKKSEDEPNEMKYCVGSIIELNSKRYRIVVLNEKYVIIIQINIPKYHIVTIRTNVFYGMIKNEELHIVREETDEIILRDMLTDSEREKMNKRELAIKDMLEQIYPDYEILQRRIPCPEFETLKNILGVGTTMAHRLIRLYLQSGRNPSVLCDRRKFRKSQKPAELSIEIIKKKKIKGADLSKEETEALFFNSVAEEVERSRGQYKSLKSIYKNKVMTFYSDVVTTPEGTVVISRADKPSYDRTRRYVISHTELTKIRDGYKSEKDFRNNNRLLKGNAKTGVVGICDVCEMDECATDILLVSRDDRSQVIHRVVMYVIIDVKTSMIIACWPDYQDNSYIGATNCFLTLCEDHNIQTSQYGVKVTNNIYPSCVIPRVLRCDHGAEYMSKEFKRFCMETGIILDPVAPGTGSLKSYVEQCFHQFHTTVMSSAIGKGAILKDGFSNHYQTACANIDEARKICFLFVRWCNQHQRPDDYPLTPEQIQNGIPAIPCKMWAYEYSVHDTPRMITASNKDSYLYAMLLADEKFVISRRGIYCKGRYYYCEEEWLDNMMLDCGKHKRAIECRYDPRTAGAVYLLVNKVLKKVPLAAKREEQEMLEKLTWNAANELYKQKIAKSKEESKENEDRLLSTQLEISDVFRDAKKNQGGMTPRKDGMREAFIKEKQKTANENPVELKTNVQNESNKDRTISVETATPKLSEPDRVVELSDDDRNPFL